MSDNKEAREIQALQNRVLQLEEANRELREAAKNLRSIMSQSIDGVAIIDELGEVIEWNPSLEEITGIPARQVLGKAFWEVQYRMMPSEQQTPETLTQLKESIDNLLKTGQSPWLRQQMLREYHHPDGGQRFIQGAVFPIQTERGFMLGSISRDITESKHAEQALRESQEITQNYLDIARIMLIALDTQQRVTMINPKGCEILGYSQEEILGQNWFDKFIPQEDIDQVKQVFNQIVTGEIKPVEYYRNPILRKDGEQRLIAWHNSILRDQSGSIIGIFSSGEDITELMKLNATLRLTQFAVDRAVDACYWINEQGDFIYVNDTALQMLGYAREEILSMSVKDIDPNYPQEIWAQHWNELREKGQMVLETYHRANDGQLIPIEAAVNFLEFEGKAYNLVQDRFR